MDADWLHHVCRGAGAAVAAGVAHLGIHRNVIHPRFGSFVLLGTVLLDAEASAYDQPLADNPCLACKLCVAACPTGAIAPVGHFNFAACYRYNYREFMGAFTDWVEQVADSRSALESEGPLAGRPVGGHGSRPGLTDVPQLVGEGGPPGHRPAPLK